MKEEKKFNGIFKILIVISILFVALMPNIVHKHVVFADSGFGTDYSSSSSSSSWDSDYDYDSGDYDGGGGSFFSLAFFIIIIIIVALASKGKGTENNSTVTQTVNDENIENQIKQYIPNFNKTEFLNEGFKIYCDVQNAWMNFKLEDVKDVITDELYNMYESQLSTLEVKGEQNIMKDIKLKQCYLTDVVNQNNNITITTKYVIEMYDYIIEQGTGKVLRGSSTNKLRITYEMKLRKTLNENAKVEQCPNCGGKITMNSSGTCEYCGSKIVADNTKWVLTEKKTINQV